jgi:hypothetical protein
MYSVSKIIKKTAKSDEGFVFLLAVLGIFILVAIGFFALTTISEELMISSRLVGERKAYSAAEAGVHAVCANGNYVAFGETQVDPVNDPTVYYSATVPGDSLYVESVVLPGYGAGYSSKASAFEVTGVDKKYGSKVTIEVGIADKPVPGGLPLGPPGP